MEGSDRILDRIKKMLRLAADAAATEGERDNAMRMAYATMAKHNIDMAEIEASGKDSEKREEYSETYFGRPWGRSVSASVAQMLFCKYVVTHVGGEKSKLYKHRFIGRTSNAITAAGLAKYLVESITAESRKRYGSSGSAEGRTFNVGAARAIHLRVLAMIQEAVKPPKELGAPTPGTAVVLANRYRTEEEANMALMCQLYPRLRPAQKGKSVYDSEAYRAGQQYGSTVSLNRQIKGS